MKSNILFFEILMMEDAKRFGLTVKTMVKEFVLTEVLCITEDYELFLQFFNHFAGLIEKISDKMLVE